LQALYEVKVQFTGKQGRLSEIMKDMAKLPKEEKPAFGKAVNDVKGRFEEAYGARESRLRSLAIDQKIQSDKIDVTLPGAYRFKGSRHPIHLVIEEVVNVLTRMGYAVRTGPQIEKDWFNFEALNIPPDHPARDTQDTFYIDDGHVLRTHTSPIQIHAMMAEKPPLRVLAPGSVFRCDSDVTHSPNFHQIERPSFFPFTEPSAEFDCSCPACAGKGCRLCKQSGWIEIGGCGLVNPKVLKAVKINPDEWQGFAFGFGIERMAIVKYGIEDIRLFNENDLRFLRQFTV
jgi:phenylalanyl-tRNA synthetase alpha chain